MGRRAARSSDAAGELARRRWRAVDRYKEVGVEVERIDVPALVVHGELDRVVPVANGRLLAARMPRAELVVLPSHGHAPMLEEPGAFGELVCALPRPASSAANSA